MKVNINKEVSDIYKLERIIRSSKWVDNNTIIVNCSPDYSSILCQIINHKLSDINNNELFEELILEMPYPTSNIIFDKFEQEHKNFDKYLLGWVSKYIDNKYKYLFLDSGTIRGRNFSKVKFLIREKRDYRFGTLYLEESSIFIPDFYVEKYDKIRDGGLVFEWENLNNPNWNY